MGTFVENLPEKSLFLLRTKSYTPRNDYPYSHSFNHSQRSLSTFVFRLRVPSCELERVSESVQNSGVYNQREPPRHSKKKLAHEPRIVGFGVYNWNTRQTYEVISILKKIRPDLTIVLGGPEVSHETSTQPICQLADYTIQGEAELLFFEFCKNFLEESRLPTQKWVSGALPLVTELVSPYSYYTDEDIAHRIIYVEASRGCPYKCEYCLSSLDKSVRNFNIDSFLVEMERLIQRGARQFKFVDRTFNLSIAISTRILQFFLDAIEKNPSGLFLHFEMVPDRLPIELKELIKKFPPGSLQFEIGIQTWNPEVAKRVSRRMDYSKIKENFQFLTQETGVHIHADLIAGLPDETFESFSQGFDAVSDLNPHEIQVGILKRLKGTPIMRHDQTCGMVYQEHSPFQILKTNSFSFVQLQQINRFSQFWDLIANSGNFKSTLTLLRRISTQRETPSFFLEFFRFSLFLAERHPQGNGIALINLVESTWIYLTQNLKINPDEVRSLLIEDYTTRTKRDIPAFLRENTSSEMKQAPQVSSLTRGHLASQLNPTPKRQVRHLVRQ